MLIVGENNSENALFYFMSSNELAKGAKSKYEVWVCSHELNEISWNYSKPTTPGALWNADDYKILLVSNWIK